jgi:hypothetical protein
VIIILYSKQAIVSNLWEETKPVKYFIDQLNLGKSNSPALAQEIETLIMNTFNRPLSVKGISESFFRSREFGDKSVILFGLKEFRAKQVWTLLSVVVEDAALITRATSVNNNILYLISTLPEVQRATLAEKHEYLKDYLAADTLFKNEQMNNIVVEKKLDLLSGYFMTSGYLEVERYNLKQLNYIPTYNKGRIIEYTNGMYTQLPFSKYQALKFFFRDSQYLKFGVPYGHTNMDYEILPLKDLIIKMETVQRVLILAQNQK